MKGLQKEIFERANNDGEFAYGLGYSLGFIITYFPAELQNIIFEESKRNKDLVEGLG